MPWLPVDTSSDPDTVEYRGDPADLFDALHELLEAIQRPAWHSRAVCRGQGPDKWFPARSESNADAIAACDGCPVRQECRDYALADPSIDGIWAGGSKATRRAMRRSVA
ncbi:MAG: WhiB family transcriptional regulator [Acidimicrobiales bacterium]